MIELGNVIGRIRIDRQLGVGGMGVVFAGMHLDLQQEVAVKVLRDEFAQDTVIVERFLREARSVARLRTEHVCRVFDVGRLPNGSPYIVMELLDGSDLGSAIARGPLPVPLAIDYVLQACVALGEAHAAGIVHRDLKPANLFAARRDGRTIIKVLDFGIAKAATAAEARLTGTASMIGTPAFMSPEQIKSARDVDLRTDIWALGVTLYQLVSGRLPFYATRLADVAIRVIGDAPDPLEVGPRLHAVIMRCLEKEPERRYGSVAELVAELSAVVPAQPQVSAQLPAPSFAPATAPGPPATVGPTMGTSAPPPARRSRRGLAIGAIAGVVGVGAIVAIAVSGGGPPKAPADAQPAAVRDAAVADAQLATGVDAARAIDAMPPPDAAAPVDAPEAAPADAPVPGPAAAPGNPYLALPEQRKQLEKALQGIDQMIVMYAKNPQALESALAGGAQLACMLGNAAKAGSYYKRLTADKNRKNVERTCEQAHVTLPR